MNEQSKANLEVYVKLAVARAKLRGRALKKSGRNKFANYDYFELGDFLHPTLEIFDELGLIEHRDDEIAPLLEGFLEHRQMILRAVQRFHRGPLGDGAGA